ncbi:MAG: hypothetical protein AAGA29_06620 [Planctomycetota bacterium]
MKRSVIETLNRYRFVIASLVILICGGGCMMSFQPQRPVALQQLGVDDHTRARVEGQADPRPTDPQPHTGLNGTLVIAEVVQYPPNTQPYHYPPYIDASVGDSDPGKPETYPFFVLAPKITTGMTELLSGLEGITGVIPLTASDFVGGHANHIVHVTGRDALLQTARDAGGDLLLIYTASTDADATDVTLSIGAILTLGLGPTVVVSGEAELQAVLMDAHTGYVYALAEADGDSLGISNAWGRESGKMGEADDSVAEAVAELIGRLEAAWPAMRASYP